jgi:hypothetical protein
VPSPLTWQKALRLFGDFHHLENAQLASFLQVEEEALMAFLESPQSQDPAVDDPQKAGSAATQLGTSALRLAQVARVAKVLNR